MLLMMALCTCVILGSGECVDEARVQCVIDNGDVKKLLDSIVERLSSQNIQMLRGPRFIVGENKERLDMSRKIAIFFKKFNVDFCTLRLGAGDIE